MNSSWAKSMILNFFNPKSKVLVKQSKGKNITNEDVFTVNNALKSPFNRMDVRPKNVVKIEENEEDSKRVVEERRMIVDAVIVRISKARKIIRHNELIPEVARQIEMFRAQPGFIKKQIDGLIEREFLRRDDEDRALYHYIP